MTVNREALYRGVGGADDEGRETVWVSANFFGRVCHTSNVPHPPRGYWAKLKVGTALPKPELPPAEKDCQTTWRRYPSGCSARKWPQMCAAAELSDVMRQDGWTDVA
jgi:hypothetical protein